MQLWICKYILDIHNDIFTSHNVFWDIQNENLNVSLLVVLGTGRGEYHLYARVSIGPGHNRLLDDNLKV